jgi:hypothetical protein
VGFVVDKVALGPLFSKYFGFPCQFTFYRLLHIHYLSSGASTIGQMVADVPSGLSLTPPQETKKKKKYPIPLCTVHSNLAAPSRIWAVSFYGAESSTSVHKYIPLDVILSEINRQRHTIFRTRSFVPRS